VVQHTDNVFFDINVVFLRCPGGEVFIIDRTVGTIFDLVDYGAGFQGEDGMKDPLRDLRSVCFFRRANDAMIGDVPFRIEFHYQQPAPENGKDLPLIGFLMLVGLDIAVRFDGI